MLSQQQVTEKVKLVLNEKLDLDIDLLPPSASLYKDLSIDSLDLLEVLAELEKIFNIKVDEDDFEKVSTVGELCSLIFKAIT